LALTGCSGLSSNISAIWRLPAVPAGGASFSQFDPLLPSNRRKLVSMPVT